VTAGEVDVTKFGSPKYVASSWTLDPGGDGNTHVAEPTSFVAFHVVGCDAHPEMGLNVVPPSRDMRNSACPVGAVGLSDPGAVIVKSSVAVMVCPVTDGFTTADTIEAVAARFTVWVTGVEVDPVKLESPE
jgi:hypothetical protein